LPSSSPCTNLQENPILDCFRPHLKLKLKKLVSAGSVRTANERKAKKRIGKSIFIALKIGEIKS
jgi:hypothetical protein